MIRVGCTEIAASRIDVNYQEKELRKVVLVLSYTGGSGIFTLLRATGVLPPSEKKPHANLLKARSRVSFGSFFVGLGMFVRRGTASAMAANIT